VGTHLGESLSIWWVLPFVGILLSIALFPLFAGSFWHRHFPKVSLFWALALVVPFVLFFEETALYEIAHILLVDYIPFIILLWALYTVSSGILLTGTLDGSPRQNTLVIASGTLLASFIGTTGASMVMVRPLLRAIAWRRHKAHVVVFFIFLVSNIGGSLTPLGDPPLFLGFLHHVPFFWTLHLAPATAFVAIPLLAVFYLIDRRYYAREASRPVGAATALGIRGWQNFLCLAAIVGVVLMSAMLKLGDVRVWAVNIRLEGLLRDALLIAIGVTSLKTTAPGIHRDNQFSWFPIKEVAILFAGIFVTIIPALAILRAGEHGVLKPLIDFADHPRNYFWLAGGLSSFLDNAPTYLTFFNTALGSLVPPGLAETDAVQQLVATHGHYLQAISCGAVFMGANTYIGNAPNFMVKSIAEESGIEMPSFFGYMFKFSIPFLIPMFLLATLVFFR
jgi:Na+/H+ antiporter NhaD/arsenite permease-like protein